MAEQHAGARDPITVNEDPDQHAKLDAPKGALPAREGYRYKTSEVHDDLTWWEIRIDLFLDRMAHPAEYLLDPAVTIMDFMHCHRHRLPCSFYCTAECQPSGSPTSNAGWVGPCGLTTGGIMHSQHRRPLQLSLQPSRPLSLSLSAPQIWLRYCSKADHRLLNLHLAGCMIKSSAVWKHSNMLPNSRLMFFICEQVKVASAKVPKGTEVLCLYQNDSWFRDPGPMVWLIWPMQSL